MWLCPVRKPEKGFTLIEILAVTIIIGVIAAIAAPNFVKLLTRNQVNQDITAIEGALREAQKRATRNSRNCTISINAAARTIANNGANDTCLLTTRNINNNFTLNTNRNTITFSGKGNITLAPTPVIVLSTPNATLDIPRCVVIETSLGSMRNGNYTAPIPIAPAVPLPGSCQ